MKTLTLVEHETAPAVRLTLRQRDALRRHVPSVAVSPAPGAPGRYDLTPGSWVGAAHLEGRDGRDGLALHIRPKLPVAQVLFLIAYALDPARWGDVPFDFPPDTPVPRAVVPAFLALVQRATGRGLLCGYHHREASGPALRGRLRLDAQVGRRWGAFPPLEVAFDDFSPDVPENRLLKAALRRLGRPGPAGTLTPAAAGALRRALDRFDAVADADVRPDAVPAVHYTRLNAHYRPAVELARRLLKGEAFDLGHGDVPGTTFLVDMNAVFETFVVTALREALGLSAAAFPHGATGKALPLDRAGGIRLRPDLSWWAGRRCLFVGDAKYKRTRTPGVEHPDLYQLLAYAVAARLPGGLLVYAAGEEAPAAHLVDGKSLQVTALDLAVPPAAVLGQIATIAGRVRRLRRLAPDPALAAAPPRVGSS